MKLTWRMLEAFRKEQGDSFYLLNSNQFRTNYVELLEAFRTIYPNTHIAYSYKTNYIPKLCKIIDEYGGFAEVVSDMEYEVARKLGVKHPDIYFNGPYKNPEVVETLLVNGGIVNIDSYEEFKMIRNIANNNLDKRIAVGIRCNYDVGDGVTSRFGIDVLQEEFTELIHGINRTSNLYLSGLHCHFATRYLPVWANKVRGMLELVEEYFQEPPEFISVGGGLFGKMEDSLKQQFDGKIPSYEEYAEVIATPFQRMFSSVKLKPKLIIEPGSALAGDVMKFAARVMSIKDIRGKKIATLAGSVFNINPTFNKKNPPITVYRHEQTDKRDYYTNLDFAGYTCIESDYLYHGFNGELAVGDFIVFDNVGSYSIVLKPPFILPNVSVIDYDDNTREAAIVKHRESVEDVFQTYVF